jgi:hypothetical protein
VILPAFIEHDERFSGVMKSLGEFDMSKILGDLTVGCISEISDEEDSVDGESDVASLMSDLERRESSWLGLGF